MLDSTSSATKKEEQEDLSLSDQIRAGFEYRAIELVATGYKKMRDNGRYNLNWKENKFTAVLRGYVDKQCQEFSRRVSQQWAIDREHYHDNEDVIEGEADADAVPRIDIVVLTWLNYEKLVFPFECKLVAENDSTLIRLYVKKGLIERYLTEKNYASGASWGEMIAYILSGNHSSIVEKLNAQIHKQIGRTDAYLRTHSPINQFDAIYVSSHQYSESLKPLAVTHLLLTFFN